MSKDKGGRMPVESTVTYARDNTADYSLLFFVFLLVALTGVACGLKGERSGVPAEVEAAIATVSDDIAQERYDKIYNESADLWKRDATLEQSTEVFKTLRTKLGKVESHILHSASEENNSGGALKGHAFIVTYQTKFERGEGMETFTLIEQNHQWLLARYLVTSTALK
jgi:hypothetical protein